MTTAIPGLRVPAGFLWGASTAPHQIEGNNVLSDWWAREQDPGYPRERSGDAIDSYHRYPEDMRLLADAGLTAYRFGFEWARIEPEPGRFSLAELDHYRRMVDTARDLGLAPVVTLHHFTLPNWLARDGGWLRPGAVDAFARYVEYAASALSDVDWVCTINEPNMVASTAALTKSARADSGAVTALSLPTPDDEITRILTEAHRRAVDIVHAATSARAGWTVATQQFTPAPGAEETFARIRYGWEDRFLEVARDDDFLGVQAYSSQQVDQNGPVPHPPHPDNTLTRWAYRPDALETGLRHAWEVTGGTPLLVTENGIATDDDHRRVHYTTGALRGLASALADGIDVRGYLHWSALDNFEWGSFIPTFGLIAVDRTTFARTPKPSLTWLGQLARATALAASH